MPHRHLGRGGIPACQWLHIHGKAVSRHRRSSNFTRSPYTIPGCTYAPTSITPGAGLPYETLFTLPAGPARDPRAGAVHAAFHIFSVSAFRPVVKSKNAPSASANFDCCHNKMPYSDDYAGFVNQENIPVSSLFCSDTCNYDLAVLQSLHN